VDRDARACRVKGGGERRTDATRGAGDEYSLAGERHSSACDHGFPAGSTIAGRYHGARERRC
jgi:hypothetical protein